MAYQKQGFVVGQTLTAAQMNHLEAGIAALDTGKLNASALPEAVNAALAQAKESGEFDGAKGDKGDKGDAGKTPVKGTDYWTAADIEEMVNTVIASLPVYNGEVV